MYTSVYIWLDRRESILTRQGLWICGLQKKNAS
uniref:Uncharacterized protein n=1 Tax=Anguilla anguilla TaxID=7936 RepID=A0A0E9SCD0_ANGAN